MWIALLRILARYVTVDLNPSHEFLASSLLYLLFAIKNICWIQSISDSLSLSTINNSPLFDPPRSRKKSWLRFAVTSIWYGRALSNRPAVSDTIAQRVGDPRVISLPRATWIFHMQWCSKESNLSGLVEVTVLTPE